MSDFSHIVKRLDIAKARVATRSEAALALKPFDKYYGIQKTRPIVKIPTVFTLAANAIDVVGAGQFQRGELIFQYNVTVGASFIIDRPFQENVNLGGVLCVKYREGTVVKRYALYGTQKNVPTGTDILAFTPYSNQVIKSNCCFEFWVTYLHPQALTYGLDTDYKVTTALLVNPANAEELERVIAGAEALSKAEIGVAVPETLPHDQANQAWLDNDSDDMFFFGDNGYDPILGSPYPPINYQALITTDPIRITWNLPDLHIKVFVNIVADVLQTISITNYDSGDTEASQVGNIVTLTGGALRFVDTASDAGREIKWGPLFPNTSETATVVSVISPTQAVVAEDQTVESGKFIYLPPGIVFKLFVWNTATSLFEEVADSVGGNSNGYIYQLYDTLVMFPDLVLNPLWWSIVNQAGTRVPAYVTATNGTKTISSANFLIYPQA